MDFGGQLYNVFPSYLPLLEELENFEKMKIERRIVKFSITREKREYFSGQNC